MKIRSNVPSAARSALLLSAAAGLLAFGAAAVAESAEEAEAEKVACYGINKCKGTGDCSGAGHACSGGNACKGQGHINLPEDVCLRIDGGHLVAGPGERG